jgi:chromate transport protein ChrA
MGKGGIFIITNIILLIVFLALIKYTFQLTGNLFLLELIILAVLIVMALDSTWQYTKGNNTSTGALTMFFAIILVNELGLNIFAKTPLHLILIVTAALGFILTITTKKEKCECCQTQPEETHYETTTETQTTPVEEENIVYQEEKPKKQTKKKTKKNKRK